MKKIILVMLAAILIGCSSDDDDPKTEFLNYNPLRGQWYRVYQNDSIIVNYGDSIVTYKRYERDTQSYRAGYWEEYRLTKTEIVFFNDMSEFARNLYKLHNDTLSVDGYDGWMDEYVGWIDYKRLQ